MCHRVVVFVWGLDGVLQALFIEQCNMFCLFYRLLCRTLQGAVYSSQRCLLRVDGVILFFIGPKQESNP